MSKLELHKVRWKNLLSYGNHWTEVDLTKSTTTLIVGPNGAGKSTFLDAISFGLFNRPFRRINKPSLVNSITNKNCLVEVEAVVNNHKLKVVRGIKPAIFEIYVDGKIIEQDSDADVYQRTFEQYILKCNHKTFCQVVALGSAIFTPFMALKTQERRPIIDDFLNLTIITTMNRLLKDKIDATDYEIYQKEGDKKLVEEKLKLTYEHIRQIQQSSEKAIAEKQQRIDQAQISITSYNSEKIKINTLAQQLENQIYGKEKIKTRVDELTKIGAQLNQKVNHLTKEIVFFETNQQCPTCDQPIDPNFKRTTIATKTNHLQEIQDGLVRLDKELVKSNQQLLEIATTQQKIIDYNDQVKNCDLQIENLEKYIEELTTDIRQTKETTDDVSRPVELENQLKTLNDDLSRLNETSAIQNHASILLKDTGIKAQIIKTYIPIINQLISKYTSILDFFVDFRLNEEFEETIMSRFRDVFSYENFSEGEKMRLNLAILFTWRAIAKMRNSIDCNIVVFDEILDSSMDSEGVDNLMKLLYSLTNNENIFVISHRDIIIDKFDRVIQFEKKGNFSKMV